MINNSIIPIPRILEQIDYTHKPLDYKWERKETTRFLSQQVIDKKLLNSISTLNYKAAFGFASAAAEWIYWRLLNWRPKGSGKTLNIAFNATQNHWLGQIDKYYILDWSNGTTHEEIIKDKIEPPLWVSHELMSDARFNYKETRPTLYGNATRLLTLARYVSTQEKLFDDWWQSRLLKAQKLFPNKQWPIGEELSSSNMDNNYDPNNDPFIPRQFYFEEGFDYETADLVSIQQHMLSEADYKENDLLNPPEDMIAEGFRGIPYQYEPE